MARKSNSKKGKSAKCLDNEDISLKKTAGERERESEYMCVSNEPLNTGLVNYSSNVLTKQRRTRELFNEAHHNIRLYNEAHHNITLFNHYLSRVNHQQTQKIIDFNMSFCI